MAAGKIDAAAVTANLKEAGITLSDSDFAGLLTESIEHASRLASQDESARRLDELDVSRMALSMLPDGMDLGGLYELAAQLTEQGVK